MPLSGQRVSFLVRKEASRLLIHTFSPTLRKEVDLTRADMIRFAYWTSVQFERYVDPLCLCKDSVWEGC